MTRNLGGGILAEQTYLESAAGLTYLGEQTVSLDSAAAPATLPDGTNFVMIAAEGGAVRYTPNGTGTANSGGYVPEDGYVYIVKVENLTSLSLYGVSPAKAHLLYYREP